MKGKTVLGDTKTLSEFNVTLDRGRRGPERRCTTLDRGRTVGKTSSRQARCAHQRSMRPITTLLKAAKWCTDCGNRIADSLLEVHCCCASPRIWSVFRLSQLRSFPLSVSLVPTFVLISSRPSSLCPHARLARTPVSIVPAVRRELATIAVDDA